MWWPQWLCLWPTLFWAAEAIKKEVGLPVIACGSITTPELAEQILEAGKADFIGLGRPLFADPHWPKKAKEGRPEDIRPCIRCNDGCLERSDAQGRAVLCTVNVALGAEEEFKISPAQFPKKVAVIGGGVAGMEAARVCALRGHDVTVYEKRRLGGVVTEGSIPEFKSDLRPLMRYFTTQMAKLNIRVIDQEATVNNLKEDGFDAVIVAIGGSPLVPDVPGIESVTVVGALEVLGGTKQVGTKVLILGGGVVGTEVGLFLAEQGKEVIFVEMLDEFMNGLLPLEKILYADRLGKQKVSVRTGQRLERVHDKGAIIIDRYGKREDISADNVVIAAGFTSNRNLIEQLEAETNMEVYEAGDCVKPRKLFDAIHEGNLAARLV